MMQNSVCSRINSRIVLLKCYLLLAPLHFPSEAITRSCLPSLHAAVCFKTHSLGYVVPSDPQTGRRMAKQGQLEQSGVRDLRPISYQK